MACTVAFILSSADVLAEVQHGDDRDPFAEAEEQEVLREREAKRRNVAMLRQMAPPQVWHFGHHEHHELLH